MTAQNVYFKRSKLPGTFRRSSSYFLIAQSLSQYYSRMQSSLRHFKKDGLDCDNLSHLRPILNLSTISKLLERLVASRLRAHLESKGTIPAFQSAYRRYHSTDTALTKAVSAIVMAADAGFVSLLPLLDLSTAFDTADNRILLKRLQTSQRITGNALNWLKSYLENRSQSVNFGFSISPSIFHGVPRGSILARLLFLLCASELHQIIILHDLSCPCYADDTQLRFHIRPIDTLPQKSRLENCTSSIHR